MYNTYDISALLHLTSLESFKFIIKSGALLNSYFIKSKVGGFSVASVKLFRDVGDAFPGVYLTGINNTFENKKIHLYRSVSYDENIILVFNRNLIRRMDFHYNKNTLSFGSIDRKTLFNEYNELRNRKHFEEINEFVFHHPISLIPWLEEIWAENMTQKKEIIALMTADEKYKHIKISVKKRYPSDFEHNHFIDPKPLKALFCFHIKSSISSIIASTKECKIDKKEIDKAILHLQKANVEIDNFVDKQFKKLKYDKEDDFTEENLIVDFD